ncbi:uncharacterized protein LOC110463091 [Mizuhopecten yessoensis]|uniref:uncharacterized protein LOC110463091 n=1 Tax=Mizuhopecten yessoensis TaxID=6573 RepID=UPI000B45ED6D|nr:uncharacterized protein LOC110463091 [Mizuhopecten yessoensis]
MFLSNTILPEKLIAFGNRLCIGEVEISQINADYEKSGISTVILMLILRWKTRTGGSATLGTLLKLFQEHSDEIGLIIPAYKDDYSLSERRLLPPQNRTTPCQKDDYFLSEMGLLPARKTTTPCQKEDYSLSEMGLLPPQNRTTPCQKWDYSLPKIGLLPARKTTTPA